MDPAATSWQELDGPEVWPMGYRGTYRVIDLYDVCWCKGCPKEDAAETPGLGKPKTSE
jgi:hypothetical protein